jgi:hypothetical protein
MFHELIDIADCANKLFVFEEIGFSYAAIARVCDEMQAIRLND